MRVVLQRVSRASVRVEGETLGEIERGLVLLTAIAPGDDDDTLAWMAKKCVELRIFPDDEGRMNRSLQDVEGDVLLISQFTLYGDARKGRRPSFIGSAEPALAEKLYLRFGEMLESMGTPVAYGRFAAHMEVELVNDGPVTLILDR